MTENSAPLGPGDHVFLVDGSSFVFRAYFQSIRQDQKYNYRSDRLPIGAVRLFCDQAAAVHPRGRGRHQADASRHHLRQIGEFVPQGDLPRLQGQPARAAGRPDPAIPADARRGARLRPDARSSRTATRPTTSSRPMRAQARERGADVLIVSADKDLMQLDRARRRHVRSGLRRAGAGAREERRIGPDEVVDYFGVPPGQGRRRAGAGRRFHRQRAGRARHRRQDRRAADRRIWRSRNAAGARRRDQAAQAPRDADQSRDRRADPRLEASSSRSSRDVALEVPLDDLGAARSPMPRRLVAFLKAMEFTTHHQARRRDLRRRRRRRSSPTRALSAPAAGAARNGEADRAAEPPRRPPIAAPQRAGGRAGADADAALTPGRLAAARARRGARAKIRPRRLRDGARRSTSSTRWIAEAFEAGVVAFDTETTSLDPMQAELVGISLCVAPGRACYVPLGHRGGATAISSAAASCCRARLPEAEVLARLKPLLEDAGVLKIAQNIKFDWHVFAQRGIEVAPVDDTMLISYVLDAGAQRGPRHGRARASAASATSRSSSARSPAPGKTSSASPACRSTRRPNTPPRTPT